MCLANGPWSVCISFKQKQVGYIMQEYDDAVQRAERLSAARDNFLTGKSNPPTLVTPEDLTIYTRWLVCHLHSLRTIHHYLQVGRTDGRTDHSVLLRALGGRGNSVSHTIWLGLFTAPGSPHKGQETDGLLESGKTPSWSAASGWLLQKSLSHPGLYIHSLRAPLVS